MPLYAYCPEDGSYFGADNLSVIDVPADVEDVEEYLSECDLDKEDLFDIDQLRGYR